MAGTFDATMKQLLDACAADWIGFLAPLFGLPPTVTAVALDAELSTVQPTADKVFQFCPPHAGLLHLEPQSEWDGTFPTRMLKYSVLLEDRYTGPVYTVAILLRREANATNLTGTLTRAYANGNEYLRFNYSVIRVWELEADQLLAGGLGAAPLALLTDDAVDRLPQVRDRLTERVEHEIPNTADANRFLSCAYLLLGLRYDRAIAQALFAGVQKMRESSTYQLIREEGVVEGRVEGRVEGLRESLLALLRERFSEVPPEVEARIQATTNAALLRAALLRTITIASPADLPLD